MGHRSPLKKAPKGFRTLLLAGTAAICASSANAEPITPFWLLPTTLANGLGIEKAAAAEQVNTIKAKVFAKQTVNLLSLNEAYANAQDGFEVPLPFSEQSSTDGDAPFSLKLRSGSFDIEPAVGVKIGRLADGANFS